MSSFMHTLFFTLCLVLASTSALAQSESNVMTSDVITPIVAPDPPQESIEEVTVSGEQPGPGLWKISKDDHVLWILGTLQPLPKKMTWRSRIVEMTIEESQELLTAASVDADVGFFNGMLLVPSLLGVRKNPDGARLEDLLPPDLYARWTALKARYIGRNEGIEKWRPIFAAQELYSKAIEKSGLTTTSDVLPVVSKIAKQHRITITKPQLEVAIDKPRAAIKQFKKSSLDDIECFSKTLERLETDLDAMRARATAWAVGDVDALKRLPYPDQFGACGSAILNSQIVQDRGLQDMPARLESLWLEAAESALARNESTFAVLPISQMLRADGYVAKLQARGYVVEAP